MNDMQSNLQGVFFKRGLFSPGEEGTRERTRRGPCPFFIKMYIYEYTYTPRDGNGGKRWYFLMRKFYLPLKRRRPAGNRSR